MVDSGPTSPAVGLISSLHVFPLKSAAGVALDRATLTPEGLRYDRCWCVVDDLGRVQDQRNKPMLALLRPSIDVDAATLTIHAPHETGLGPLRLPLEEQVHPCPTFCYNIGLPTTACQQYDHRRGCTRRRTSTARRCR